MNILDIEIPLIFPNEQVSRRTLDDCMPSFGIECKLTPAKRVVATKSHLVGTLTVKERKEKLQLYKEKRRKRSFRKRISYDCRKKVADERLRIKGRFVTKEYAIELLGADHALVKQYFMA